MFCILMVIKEPDVIILHLNFWKLYVEIYIVSFQLEIWKFEKNWKIWKKLKILKKWKSWKINFQMKKNEICLKSFINVQMKKMKFVWKVS